METKSCARVGRVVLSLEDISRAASNIAKKIIWFTSFGKSGSTPRTERLSVSLSEVLAEQAKIYDTFHRD